MALTLVTAASGDLVTLDELRAHLNIDDQGMDGLLRGFIAAATAEIEGANGWLGRAFLTQTWKFTIDEFTAWRIRIPLAPLASITSIEYIALDGTLTTLSSSLYSVFTGPTPGFVEPVYGQSWPSARYQSEAVRITYVCGYGAAAAVPDLIKLAIKMRAGALLAARESSVPGMPEVREWDWARNMLENLRVRVSCP